MALIVGFAELLAAFLLITKGIAGPNTSWADILKGNAAKQIAAEETSSSNDSGVTYAGGNAAASKAAFTNPGTISAGGGTGSKLNSSQETFAETLAKDTGLSLAVVQGWVLSEEPASASQAPNGANNWLNIGDTGSGNFGGSNSVWDNPTAAANLTAQWLSGAPLAGYGPASAGIQAIIASAGKSIADQVHAIQNSGWAASGYPDLFSVVQEFL